MPGNKKPRKAHAGPKPPTIDQLSKRSHAEYQRKFDIALVCKSYDTDDKTGLSDNYAHVEKAGAGARLFEQIAAELGILQLEDKTIKRSTFKVFRNECNARRVTLTICRGVNPAFIGIA